MSIHTAAGQSEVCPACLDLNLAEHCPPASGYYINDPVSLQAIATSAESGCTWCCILYFAVDAYTLRDGSTEIVVTKKRPSGQFICTLNQEGGTGDSATTQLFVDGGIVEMSQRASVEINKLWNKDFS